MGSDGSVGSDVATGSAGGSVSGGLNRLQLEEGGISLALPKYFALCGCTQRMNH
jgi:hypothetical protein